ncbi:hypothetical protein [Lysobacter sp. Root690]|uniref:hypothetical protein n=1 Tax=Lysobacter sp. Root690 TaxID=1736588 RepID=UPI0006FF1761|nr:hypothetical protein [Lysobacter sp. Root690]KRB06735.1 hypothetical protein ASD86_12015 [Lysobacter sp. Root690]
MSTSPREAQIEPLPDSLEDGDELQWDVADGSDAISGQIQSRPLNPHDRVVLASMREGCDGIIGFLGAMALIIAICLGLSGIYTLDVGAIAAVASVVVCLLAAVGFLLSKEDGKLQSDLNAGIKLIVSGRIVRMDSEETSGPGFLTVAVDETPARQIKFFVEKRLYLQVKPDDLVRIAYVPLSKTILQLRTGHCRYGRRPDPDKVRAGTSA